MKIKTKLKLAAIFLSAITISVGLLLFFVARQVDESLRRGETARQIVKGASELNFITYDYLLYPGERAIEQWRQKHASLSTLISNIRLRDGKEEIAIEKRIFENHEAIKSLFDELIARYARRENLWRTESIPDREASAQVASQLVVKTQTILNDASLLRNKSDIEIARTEQRAYASVLVSLTLMIIIVVFTSLRLSKSIPSSLKKLEEGTQIIAGGNLDYRVNIGTRDETGKLAAAFNEMANRLKTSYASIEERTAELARQSRIFEGFFKSTITPLVFLDRNFNFIRVNDAYAKSCQRDISEFEGHNHFEFYPHEENEAIFRKVVETKVPYQAIAKPFSFPDHPEWGTTYWDWTLTPLLDDMGEAEFLVFSLEDVTKQKRTELALQEASLYARSLIEASIDPLVTISRDGKIMDVNRATELATGLSRDTLVGSDFSNYFTEPDKAREGYEQVFSKGSVRDYPLAIRHTSGRVIEVLYNATIYKNEAGEVQGVFAAARDITERKRAEEELEKAHDQIRFFASQCLTAQETERKRVAGELHDSIAASLGAMRFRIEKMAEEMKQGRGGPESLEDLASKVADMNSEVRRIMADLRPSILDDLGIIPAMNWLCREYQKTYPHIAVENQIGVSEDDVPDSLKTPIFRVSQEAMNNISKHSQASLVNLSLRKEDAKIQLTIQDNGQGFDLETVRKGLGLSTMRERAQLSGGSFDLESATGKGTIIRVSWAI